MLRPHLGTHKFWLLGALAAAVLVSLLLAEHFNVVEARAPRDTPEWDSVGEETTRLLSGMVRIDTSNPPGNESAAAEYIKAALARAGIESEIFESAPGRGNLVARLKGNGRKRPILLVGHTDVVGVERDQWTVDPFGGLIRDGYVYGRGSSDDKGMTSACLEVMLLLKRLNVPLDRDVIFLAEADEEETSKYGISYMVGEHWDKIDAEFALNEGGMIYQRGGRVQYLGVSTTEKVPRGIRLLARGTSGHGSMPRPDNAIVHLAAAIAKIGSMQLPMRLNDTTRAFFARLAQISPPGEAYLYTHLEDPKESAAVQEQIRTSNLGYNSMLRTSIVPTMVRGGFRSNVIPAEAEATLDVRALPDEDIDALVGRIRGVINDASVEVIPPQGSLRPIAPASRIDTDMFRALEREQDAMFPGARTLPLMLTGATDSAILRARGVQAYGVGSVATDTERTRVHGNDERISIEGLGKFVEFLYGAVIDVAASR